MERDSKILYSKESEMMVLGCMLTNFNNLKIGSETLDERDFYFSSNRLIFELLKEAYAQTKPVDVHLISEELKKRGNLEEVGGVAYLVGLAQYAGTSAYIEEYCEEVREHSRSRAIDSFFQNGKRSHEEGRSTSSLIHVLQEQLGQIEKRGSTKDKFQIKPLSQFENNFLLVEPQPKPMLLDYCRIDGKPTGFLPKGIVAMLVGAGGVGKTHLLAQLAISIASGEPFLHNFVTTEHCGDGGKGNVFLGLGENQYDDIHRVLFKASKRLRNSNPDMYDMRLSEASKRIYPFSFCGQQAAFIEEKKPSRYFRELKMHLEKKAPTNGWTLIILDPVSRLLGADAETDNAAATQFIALLEELTMSLPGNPTILFAHHVNKSALQDVGKQHQGAARGSSALTDGVRGQLNLSREQKDEAEVVVLKMTKSNFTAILEDIHLKRDLDGFLERCVTPFTNTSESKKMGRCGDLSKQQAARPNPTHQFLKKQGILGIR